MKKHLLYFGLGLIIVSGIAMVTLSLLLWPKIGIVMLILFFAYMIGRAFFAD